MCAKIRPVPDSSLSTYKCAVVRVISIRDLVESAGCDQGCPLSLVSSSTIQRLWYDCGCTLIEGFKFDGQEGAVLVYYGAEAAGRKLCLIRFFTSSLHWGWYKKYMAIIEKISCFRTKSDKKELHPPLHQIKFPHIAVVAAQTSKVTLREIKPGGRRLDRISVPSQPVI
jgi:hypothetical protein